MISVEKALNLIESHYDLLELISLQVENALGFTIGQDIYSNQNMPPFRQSAMDGYAICYDKSIKSYKIIAELQAGKNPKNIYLNKGECVRIFTGAALPNGASSVIQQEWCDVKNNQLQFKNEIKNNLNIRPIGEQLKAKEKVIAKGHVVTPATIGLLAGIGLQKIIVFKSPNVGIVITGDELIMPGEKLNPGEIYESNSFMLKTVLQQFGYFNNKIYKTKDDFNSTIKTISKALSENDVILISGGISVGDYDFVLRATQSLAVEKVFYKVNQKPGKPLFFGKTKQKAVFGLPGNPGAALTCFYIYVLKYLSLIRNCQYPLIQFKAELDNSYIKKVNRAEFLKSNINKGVAHISSFQNSSMLRSFAEANALIYISAEKEKVKKGESVPAYLLL